MSTLRGYVDAATSGAPDAWVLAARARAGAVDLDDVLDRTVVRVPVGSPRVPWTWRMLTFVQWVLLAVSGAGLVWLLLLAGMGLLQLPQPETPMRWGVPVPTLLLLAGLLGGLLVAGLGRVMGGVTGRRRARTVRRRLGQSVAEAVDEHVTGPIGAEMDALARCRAAAGCGLTAPRIEP